MSGQDLARGFIVVSNDPRVDLRELAMPIDLAIGVLEARVRTTLREGETLSCGRIWSSQGLSECVLRVARGPTVGVAIQVRWKVGSSRCEVRVHGRSPRQRALGWVLLAGSLCASLGLAKLVVLLQGSDKDLFVILMLSVLAGTFLWVGLERAARALDVGADPSAQNELGERVALAVRPLFVGDTAATTSP